MSEGGRPAARPAPDASLDPGAADIDCLDVLEVGIGGGPIDVRFPGPAKLCLGFTDPGVGLEPMDGVVVRGVDAPDGAPEDSCFVGDFVGDYSILVSGMANKKNKDQQTLSMLPGRPNLAAGLGLDAFMLILLPAAGSLTLPTLLAGGATTLDGLLVLFGTGAAFGGGGGACSKTWAAWGLTNIPLPISQSK